MLDPMQAVFRDALPSRSWKLFAEAVCSVNIISSMQ